MPDSDDPHDEGERAGWRRWLPSRSTVVTMAEVATALAAVIAAIKAGH